MKIYNYQSGFRGNHSTNLCLPFLTDKDLKSLLNSVGGVGSVGEWVREWRGSKKWRGWRGSKKRREWRGLKFWRGWSESVLLKRYY